MQHLEENIAAFNRQYKNKAYDIIDEAMLTIPEGFIIGIDKLNARQQLRITQMELKGTRLKLLVCGTVKNGKSTLCVAFMGPSDDPALKGIDPLPIARTEATPRLTEVIYSPKPYARVIIDGKEHELNFRDFINAKVSQDAEEYEKEEAKDIRYRVGYPAPLLKEGLTLMDSPGFEANATRTRMSKNAAGEVTAALLVFKDTHFPDEGVRFYKELQANGQDHLFKILNLTRDYDNDERELRKLLKRVYWELVPEDQRILDGSEGLPEMLDELGRNNIFWVKAKKALNAKRDNNQADLLQSNIGEIEQKLFDYFMHPDTKKVHYTLFIQRATGTLAEVNMRLEEEISHYRREIGSQTAERDGLEQDLDETKASRDQAVTIINENKATYGQKSADSLDAVINDAIEYAGYIVAQLKPDLASTITGKYKKEVSKAVAEYLKTRLQQWQEKDIADILSEARAETLSRLSALTRQPNAGAGVAGDAQSFNADISLDNDEIGGWERVFSAAGGFFVGGLLSGTMGGLYGAEAAGSSAIGGIAAGVAAVLLGIHAIPVIIATIVIGELLGIGMGAKERMEKLPGKIKDKITKKLQKEREKAIGELKNKVNSNFDNLRAKTEAAYAADIKEINNRLEVSIGATDMVTLELEEAIALRRMKIEHLDSCRRRLTDLL